jgi:hypothetical protein
LDRESIPRLQIENKTLAATMAHESLSGLKKAAHACKMLLTAVD